MLPYLFNVLHNIVNILKNKYMIKDLLYKNTILKKKLLR